MENVTDVPQQHSGRFVRHSRLLRIFTAFVLGQGALQAVQVVAGLLLVREMNVKQYGVFGFALSVQGAVSILCDFGMRDAVIANVGSDWTNRSLLSDLVAAAWQLRVRIWGIATLGVFFAFYFFHMRQGLPLPQTVLFAVLVSATVFFNTWFIYFALPLVLAHDMRRLYRPQLFAQLGRLFIIGMLFFVGLLTAPPVMAASCFVAGMLGLWYRLHYSGDFRFPTHPTEDSLRRIRRYAMAVLPSATFYAFQDQISAFILTIFGRTENIAQVFALGRLAIVFQLSAAAGPVLILPWIARATAADLLRRYVTVLSGCLAIAASFIGASILSPDAILFILGHNYSGLEPELQIAVATMSLTFIGGIILTMNNARKWVWWWTNLSYIVLTLAIQTICIATLDMSVLRNVLLMSLWVSVGVLGVQIIQTIVGFTLRR